MKKRCSICTLSRHISFFHKACENCRRTEKNFQKREVQFGTLIGEIAAKRINEGRVR